jgi:hypothetical protein
MGEWAPSAAMQEGSPQKGCRYAARSSNAAASVAVSNAEPKSARTTANVLQLFELVQ